MVDEAQSRRLITGFGGAAFQISPYLSITPQSDQLGFPVHLIAAPVRYLKHALVSPTGIECRQRTSGRDGSTSAPPSRGKDRSAGRTTGSQHFATTAQTHAHHHHDDEPARATNCNSGIGQQVYRTRHRSPHPRPSRRHCPNASHSANGAIGLTAPLPVIVTASQHAQVCILLRSSDFSEPADSAFDRF